MQNFLKTIKYLLYIISKFFKNLNWASVTLIIILLYSNSINNFFNKVWQVLPNKLELTMDSNKGFKILINTIYDEAYIIKNISSPKNRKLWKSLKKEEQKLFIKIAFKELTFKEDNNIDIIKYDKKNQITNLLKLYKLHLINIQSEEQCLSGNIEQYIDNYLKHYHTNFIEYLFEENKQTLKLKVNLTNQGKQLYNEIYKIANLKAFRDIF